MPKPTSCIDCSATIEQKPGRGRARLRCQACRRERKATPNITCCECGKGLRGGGIRLPQGEGMCADCRRHHRPEKVELLLQCATCSRMFTTTRSHARYCNPQCSPWDKRKKPLTPRDLGARHQQIRRAFAVLVQQGTEHCCLCSEAIHPDDAWDLDHTTDREGYRGASHATCNRREGAMRRNGTPVIFSHATAC